MAGLDRKCLDLGLLVQSSHNASKRARALRYLGVIPLPGC